MGETPAEQLHAMTKKWDAMYASASRDGKTLLLLAFRLALVDVTGGEESMDENLVLMDNISSELEGLLFSANSTLESLYINIETNEQTINLLTEQRDNLQIELQQVIDSNSTVISELEANIIQLNQQIIDLETDSLSLNSQIIDAQEEISELTNTINALTDQISKLTYQLFTDTQGCPYSAPSEKMKIGWDLNSDNQLLGNEEIQMVSGDCMAGIGKVAPVDDNGNERIAQMVEMGGVLYFTADDGIHGSELWRSDGTVGGTYMVIDLTPPMCPTCENRTDFSIVNIPYACKLLTQELISMNIAPRFVTED